jgi:N-acetylmuramoyl-L-alanine amidase
MKLIGRFLVTVVASLILIGPASAARTVVIDAGHGGHDRGGVPRQRLSEKTYTLDVARRLEGQLREAGFRTVMTRSGDSFVSLSDRCAIANSQHNAVFISVHFNSGKREAASGIETYYYSRASAGYASAVHAQVLRAAGTPNRGIRRRGFYVLRQTRIPAVLAECGFLTNRAEGARITTAGHRQQLADALARAITSKYK